MHRLEKLEKILLAAPLSLEHLTLHRLPLLKTVMICFCSLSVGRGLCRDFGIVPQKNVDTQILGDINDHSAVVELQKTDTCQECARCGVNSVLCSLPWSLRGLFA